MLEIKLNHNHLLYELNSTFGRCNKKEQHNKKTWVIIKKHNWNGLTFFNLSLCGFLFFETGLTQSIFINTSLCILHILSFNSFHKIFVFLILSQNIFFNKHLTNILQTASYKNVISFCYRFSFVFWVEKQLKFISMTMIKGS